MTRFPASTGLQGWTLRPDAASVVPMQTAGETVAAAAIPLVGWAVLVAWVYQDAVARASNHPVGAAALVAVFPPALVAHVVYRDERTGPQSDRERLTLAAVLAVSSAMIIGSVFSPPDVFAQPRNTFGALLLTAPFFYLVVYRDDERADDGSPS